MSCLTARTKSPGVRRVAAPSPAACRGPRRARPRRTRASGSRRKDSAVILLQVVELTPDRHHRADHLAYRAAGHPRPGRRRGLPGLECQHGHAGGQLSRVQAVPQPAAQAFRGQQVQLGVQVGEPPAVRGDLRRRPGSRAAPGPRRPAGRCARSRATGRPRWPPGWPPRAPAGSAAPPPGRAPHGPGSHDTDAGAAAGAAWRSPPGPGRRGFLPAQAAAMSRPASLLRRLAARSRRCCGDRALKLFGIRSRSIGLTGIGKSASDSRLTWRPMVSTSGSGALPSFRPAPARGPARQAGVEDDGQTGPAAGRAPG